jgi:transcriptional antiterminator NusG
VALSRLGIAEIIQSTVDFAPDNKKAVSSVMDDTNLSTTQPSEMPLGDQPESANAAIPPETTPVAEGVKPEESPSVARAAPSEGESSASESKPASPPQTPAERVVEQPASETPKSDKMDWYILKVQSNREESIREGLRRKIKIAGLDQYFGDIIIPTEKVTEFKAGKRKVFKRKLYPGYLVVQMEINEDTWFLVRETAGIGDFTGAAGHPTPMLPREVAAILAKQEEKADEAPKLKIGFRVGDHVKIKEGTFENFEGEVANIDETNGRVTVLINIFGRSTPVDIEYWQIETV